MARPPYSQQLFSGSFLSAGVYLSESWDSTSSVVIRSMEFVPTTGPIAMLSGFRVDDLFGAPFWFMGPGNTRNQLSYHWRGRAVITPGAAIQVTTLDDGWSWTISGYVLTAT